MLVPHRALPRTIACVLLFGATLKAEEAPPQLAIHYDVAAGCPTRDWFTTRVEEQLAHGWPPAGTFDIEVEENEGSFGGVAIFVDMTGNGPPWERQLRDTDCEALLRAIVLGIVLHWESPSKSEDRTEAGADEADSAAPAADVKAVGAPAAESVSELVEPFDVNPLELPPVEDELGEPEEPERGFYPFVGAGVGMRTGLSPTTDLAGDAHLGARGLGDHFHAGRYQLLFQWSFGNDSPGATGRASTTPAWHADWWALGAHVCPWGQRNGNFVFSVCGNGQLFRYHATIPDEGTTKAAWVSTLGPGLDTAVQFDGFGLRLDVGLDLPVVPMPELYQDSPVFRQGPGIHVIVSAEVFPWDPK